MAGSSAPEGQACAVLQPAVAEAARRAGTGTVGLVDVGRGARPWASLDLRLDEVATTYTGDVRLGPVDARTRLSCRLVGGGLPTTPVPVVAARVGPVTDPVDERSGVTVALAAVPAGTLPVVLTTWALSRLDRPDRERFVELLAGAGRPCAWVSVEGVGVAPGVPTLGDRPASGHSLVGLALLDGAGGPVEPEVVARCWSRGRVLAWLAPDRTPSGGAAEVSP